jgi:hypothetical protein
MRLNGSTEQNDGPSRSGADLKSALVFISSPSVRFFHKPSALVFSDDREGNGFTANDVAIATDWVVAPDVAETLGCRVTPDDGATPNDSVAPDNRVSREALPPRPVSKSVLFSAQ